MDGTQVSRIGNQRRGTAFLQTSFIFTHSTRRKSACPLTSSRPVRSRNAGWVGPQRRECEKRHLGGVRMVQSGRDSDVRTACTIINAIFGKVRAAHASACHPRHDENALTQLHSVRAGPRGTDVPARGRQHVREFA